MSKKRTQANQNIYDISTQYHGNLDAVGDILMASPDVLPGITTPMVANMLLEVSDTPKDKAIRTQMVRRDIVPAGGDDYVVEEWVKMSLTGIVDVKCVVAGAPGEVWYGTSDGVNRYVIATGITTTWTDSNSTLPTMQVQCLYYDSILDRIICGTAAGVAWYDMTDWHGPITTVDGLPDNDVRFIQRLGTDYCIGTAGGLGVIDVISGPFTVYDTGDGLLSDSLHSALVLNGVLWFTSDAGLCSFDGSTVVGYDSSDGLGDDECTYICADAINRLWIGTADGLSVYDGANFLNYTDADVLQSDSIGPMVLDRLGIMYVADKLTSTNTLSVVRWPDWMVLTDATTALPNANIQGMAVDSQDNMWIATQTDGLWRWNRNPLINA